MNVVTAGSPDFCTLREPMCVEWSAFPADVREELRATLRIRIAEAARC